MFAAHLNEAALQKSDYATNKPSGGQSLNTIVFLADKSDQLAGSEPWEQIESVTSGVPPAVSTRWAVTQITAKFEELNRRAAIEDHRHCNAFRRRIRGGENSLSFNRSLKVVHFKRYVRD